MAAPVRGTERTIDVFEVFGRMGVPLSLTEIAQQIGVPMSTCHGTMQTLLQRGYFYVLSRRKQMYPTRRLWRVAGDIVRRDPLVEAVRPSCEWLRDKTGETILIGKREGARVEYLDVIEGLHTIRYTALPGDFKPLHSTVTGKALLGTLSDEELRRQIAALDLRPITEHTLVDPAALFNDIVASRARGYAVTRQENVREAMGIAVLAKAGDEYLAIAIAGPLARLESHYDQYVSLIRQVPRMIESEVGQ